jgi:2-dehydropantoate 2-reductase
MRVAVLGAGAIGGVIAAWMARAGHEVSVTARGDHLKAICRDGLTLDDRIAGTQSSYRVSAAASATDWPEQDLVVLGVKAPALEQIADQLAPLLGPETMVLPALNGVPWWYFQRAGGRFDGARIQCLDPRGILEACIPADRLIGCVVHVAGEVVAPGVVAQTAHRKLVLGEIDHRPSARLEHLATTLRAAGFEIVSDMPIRKALWIKLIGNLGFNPLAALTGLRMDEMLDDPELVRVARALIDESNALAAALGIDTQVSTQARIDMARSIGRARLSTLQDFEKGRRPELEGLLGAVLEIAGWLDRRLPTVEMITALTTARARHLGLIPDGDRYTAAQL